MDSGDLDRRPLVEVMLRKTIKSLHRELLDRDRAVKEYEEAAIDRQRLIEEFRCENTRLLNEVNDLKVSALGVNGAELDLALCENEDLRVDLLVVEKRVEFLREIIERERRWHKEFREEADDKAFKLNEYLSSMSNCVHCLSL